MLSTALFHITNIAGGLALDPMIWDRHMHANSNTRRDEKTPNRQGSLDDAAEQLRRLARYTLPTGAPARLLANALEIIERESTLAQRKSRSIATSGLSAGGIG